MCIFHAPAIRQPEFHLLTVQLFEQSMVLVDSTASDKSALRSYCHHFSFSYTLLKAAKEAGLHTAVETCGFAPWERIRALLPLVDLWLWDVKATPEKHEQLTGVPAQLILENLRKLDQSETEIILRCPLVPGVNDDDSSLEHIASLANQLSNVRQIDLEPYHPMGEGKSRNLGRENIFHSEFSSEQEKARWKKFIQSRTNIAVHI